MGTWGLGRSLTDEGSTIRVLLGRVGGVKGGGRRIRGISRPKSRATWGMKGVEGGRSLLVRTGGFHGGAGGGGDGGSGHGREIGFSGSVKEGTGTSV